VATTGAPSGTPSQSASAREVLGDANFTVYFIASLVSNSGTFMQTIGVPFVLYDLTGSNTWVGASVFAGLVPSLLVGPIAGILADRVSRRIVLLWANGVQAVAAVVLWLLAIHDALTPWRVVGILVVAGAGAGFQYSSAQAIVSQLVPRERLVQALRINTLGFTGARAVGPAIAGVVLHEAGATTTFGVNAVSFLVVMAALVPLRLTPFTPAGREPWGRQLRSAVDLVRSRPSMRLVISMAFLVALLGQSVAQLVAGISVEVYGKGGGAQGALLAVFGTGSIVSSLVLIFTGDRRRRSRTALTGLLLYGCGAMAVVATTKLAVGLAGFLLMGLAHVLTGISMNTALQVQVSEEYRGRVISLYLMALLAGMPIGALISGRLGDVIGLRPTLAGSGALLVAITLVAALRSNFFAGLDVTGEEHHVTPTRPPAPVPAPGATPVSPPSS
jgi:MFS family permease